MNRIEKFVHSAIGDYPFIRIPLVYIYQRLLSILPIKNYQISQVSEAPGFFFGFHDKCPWSFDERYLLAHKFDHTIPSCKALNMPIIIGIFDQHQSALSDFIPLSVTSSWNWQQGSSAQWVGDKHKIIFNDIIKEKCVSKIINTQGEIINIFPYHIANTTHDGNYAFIYSFARLGHGMSGYGYQFHKSLEKRELSNNALGILNLKTEKYTRLFTIDEFSQINFESSMENSFGFFSHCISSYNSKRFIFLHRWVDKLKRLRTRMYSINVDGSKLFKFPLKDCSHMAWFDNNTILAYCKPYNGVFGYYLMRDFCETPKKILNAHVLSDGHPQVSSDCRFIVTDTYPDRLRRQLLKIYDIISEEEILLATYRIPFKYRLKSRCDFHPRWNRSNSTICFDSAHSGVRSLCLLTPPLDK
jgi:hypothetical protein